MAKLKTDPIQRSDLVEFLDSRSDFAFELRILKGMTQQGFKCEHGGTYEDPVTGKPREFDIRATKRVDACQLNLAVECKNVREYSPVLISCIPRKADEAFHEVAYSGRLNAAHHAAVRVERVASSDSLYRAGEFVGKSLDQVARLASGDLSGLDTEIYDKWSQAVASAFDMIEVSAHASRRSITMPTLSITIPVVVVPSRRLWVAKFNDDGGRVDEPEHTERCSFFIGRRYEFQGADSSRREYTVSHLEFLTEKGLESFGRSIVDDMPIEGAFPGDLFEKHGVYIP